jgi:LAO/AO transport system kinase
VSQANGPATSGVVSGSVRARALAEEVRRGDRRALARAITLIESNRRDHRGEAEALVEDLLPYSGRSIRLGISGVPGVGKSTFVERFGLFLIEQGRRLAVLALDPSSKRTGEPARPCSLARRPAST